MPANKFAQYVKANAGLGMNLKAIAAKYRAEGNSVAPRARSQCYKLPQADCKEPCRYVKASTSGRNSAYCGLKRGSKKGSASSSSVFSQVRQQVSQSAQAKQVAAAAKRAKSACAGLAKEACLPPNCTFTNGKLRKYCTVKRVLSSQQKEALLARLQTGRKLYQARKGLFGDIQSAGAPRAKSACVGLAKEACLPPSCRFANGALRKYCGAVPAARTAEQRASAAQKAMITKMAKVRQASRFAVAQQYAGAPRPKSACVGLAKEACLPPSCRFTNGALRKYCGAVPAARTAEQKASAAQKAMITKMAKARQGSSFGVAQQRQEAAAAKPKRAISPQEHERRSAGAKKAAATRTVNDFKGIFGQIAGGRQMGGACGAW